MKRRSYVIVALFALTGLAFAGCSDSSTSEPSCLATNNGIETCDDIDNDCDGLTDEDLQCDGNECTPSNGGVEICDDVDNDCDGEVDEDLGCDDCTPSDEVCDGVDNDCDEEIDENLTRACEKDGQAGVEGCVDGGWSECVVEPTPEVCDGIDNDQDNEIDEDLQRGCNTACGSGVETCANGEWIGCDAPEPATEVCDGADNDCDGDVDEDLVRVCGASVNPDMYCGDGEESCSMGNWVGCDAARPMPEVCDNVDNDCDGQTDEDLTKDCANEQCGTTGVQICTAGQFGDCTARQPAAAEDCTNAIDDDCDGVVNNGCGGCTPGDPFACVGTDADGICQEGLRHCTADREMGPCMLGQDELATPTDEECDGLDNDCNGLTDETFVGKEQPCGGGPGDAPLDEGECVSGAWACVDGEVVCEGMIAPTDEICDDLDNDCDGEVDNGLEADIHEVNDTCEGARAQWDVLEGDGPLGLNGTIYPQNDVDMFLINVQEATSWCNPFAADSDPPFDVYFMLYNIPEGVEYDLYVTVDWSMDLLGTSQVEQSEFCAETEPLLSRYPITEAVEGMKGGVLPISEAVCGVNDDVYVLLEVVPRDATVDFSCQPYSLSIWAEPAEIVE